MFRLDASNGASGTNLSVIHVDPSLRVRLSQGFSENGKPIVRSGRKVTGLSEMAGLPKKTFA
jgi:hypothetical protein